MKDRLNEQIIPSLPPGVKLVTTYDRSDIILASIHTLTRALIEEAIVVSLIIILFLLHIRSALVAIITLPVAVLASFVPMLFLGLTSNIMSLGGIAIAIGVMVDAAIVLVENAHKKIEHAPPDADRVPLIIQAAKEVGRPIFFSLILIAVSFLPVFTLQGQGGRLFIPLAFTKTAAMFFAALLSITLSPALMVLLIRGRIFKETEHPVSRFLIRVYKPFVYVALHNPKTTLLIAAAAVASAVPLGLRIGSEFMPPLNEGSLLYMPTTLPGVSIEQARESLQTQDQIIASFPEVSSVFGKVGRADTATDPAGLDMAETVILVKPRDQWRSITVHRWYSSWAPAWLQSLLRPLWPESRPRTWAELTEELNRALNMPGWTNSLSPPIKTRIDMLTTGIRTPIGIKVYSDSLQRIEDAAQRLESTLRNIPGTRSVFAERATGGYYLDIIPNREVLARYGLNVGDVQDVIEAALGGLTVTRTVEGRERYTVNVRYPRDYRRDADTVRRILVPIRTNAGSAGAPSSGMGMTRNAPPNPGVMVAQNMGGGMGGGSTPSSGGGGVAAPGSTATDIPLFQLPPLPSGAGAGFQSPGGMGAAGSAASSSSPTARLAMVPLGQLAEVTLRTGPPMIKDENGSLVGYVYVDVDTSKRDIGGYVEEAKRTVRDALGPLPGIRLEWTGQYELLQRLSERLRFVVPLTLALIVLLLFLNFRSWIETFIVMISVPFALVGSVWLMFFLGYNTSVAVWVGIIALVGVAAETGIVMIIYLDEYYHRYRAEGRINNSEDIRRAVIDGAVMRVRPKLMTVATATIGLAPLLWSQGAGSDVMGRIAAPMVGGLLTSAFLTLEIIPVIYMYWKRLELRGEVTRGVLVGLHEINGVTSIALALGLSAPWPSRVLLLMAGVVFVVLGVLLWRGNRTVRFALAALDLFAALVGAMGLWIAQGNWLAYLGPAVAAIVGFAMIAPSIAAQIDPAPHPNI